MLKKHTCICHLLIRNTIVLSCIFKSVRRKPCFACNAIQERRVTLLMALHRLTKSSHSAVWKEEGILKEQWIMYKDALIWEFAQVDKKSFTFRRAENWPGNHGKETVVKHNLIYSCNMEMPLSRFPFYLYPTRSHSFRHNIRKTFHHIIRGLPRSLNTQQHPLDPDTYLIGLSGFLEHIQRFGHLTIGLERADFAQDRC